MANQVYANNREVSCKAADGKSICAFPDVCLSPPSPPAGPIPIPYPNTGMASDMTDGSKTVKVSGKEVMLKNKSYFKKSTGDEAATKSLGMGVVTHQIQGKVYFTSWSMDVKFEGENVVRHLDLTTHNHASFPANSPTWPYLDAAAFVGMGPCKDVAREVDTHCSEHAKKNMTANGDVKRKPAIEAMCNDEKCNAALKCVLSPYDPSNCCPQPQPKPPKTTPHHIVPKSQFKGRGSAGPIDLDSGGTYKPDKAPCICEDGTSHSIGHHGEIHTVTNNMTVNHPSVVASVAATGKSINADARWKVSEAEAVGAQAVAQVTKCPQACIETQVRDGHEKMGIKPDDNIRPTTAGSVTDPPINTTVV